MAQTLSINQLYEGISYLHSENSLLRNENMEITKSLAELHGFKLDMIKQMNFFREALSKLLQQNTTINSVLLEFDTDIRSVTRDQAAIKTRQDFVDLKWKQNIENSLTPQERIERNLRTARDGAAYTGSVTKDNIKASTQRKHSEESELSTPKSEKVPTKERLENLAKKIATTSFKDPAQNITVGLNSTTASKKQQSISYQQQQVTNVQNQGLQTSTKRPVTSSKQGELAIDLDTISMANNPPSLSSHTSKTSTHHQKTQSAIPGRNEKYIDSVSTPPQQIKRSTIIQKNIEDLTTLSNHLQFSPTQGHQNHIQDINQNNFNKHKEPPKWMAQIPNILASLQNNVQNFNSQTLQSGSSISLQPGQPSPSQQKINIEQSRRIHTEPTQTRAQNIESLNIHTQGSSGSDKIAKDQVKFVNKKPQLSLPLDSITGNNGNKSINQASLSGRSYTQAASSTNRSSRHSYHPPGQQTTQSKTQQSQQNTNTYYPASNQQNPLLTIKRSSGSQSDRKRGGQIQGNDEQVTQNTISTPSSNMQQSKSQSQLQANPAPPKTHQQTPKTQQSQPSSQPSITTTKQIKNPNNKPPPPSNKNRNNNTSKPSGFAQQTTTALKQKPTTPVKPKNPNDTQATVSPSSAHQTTASTIPNLNQQHPFNLPGGPEGIGLPPEVLEKIKKEKLDQNDPSLVELLQKMDESIVLQKGGAGHIISGATSQAGGNKKSDFIVPENMDLSRSWGQYNFTQDVTKSNILDTSQSSMRENNSTPTGMPNKSVKKLILSRRSNKSNTSQKDSLSAENSERIN